jgi:hypothetical protein
MNSTAIRFVIAAGLIYYALSGSGGGSIVPASYTGSLTSLHQAAQGMESKDRSAMADGFRAGADMVAADTRGLIKTTEVAQTFLLALLSFDYNGVAKPSKKYPAVASEVEKVFTQTLGDDIKAMTDSDRAKLADSLREMSKALR